MDCFGRCRAAAAVDVNPCPPACPPHSAGWVVLSTLFIIFFLPETKGVPVERIQVGWGGRV